MHIYASVESLQDQAAAIERLKIILDKCIDSGEFEALAEIVGRGRALLAEMEGSSARKRGLSGFLMRCGDSIRLKMVTEKVNQKEDVDLEPVRKYLEQLGPDSLKNLVVMLGDLAHYPARRMLCDLLAAQGLERIDILGSAVFDSRWYLVRNIVWVLGETGGDKALTFLRKATSHPEERVRAEVVKALGKIQHATSAELLLNLLDDESERIAAMAANELGQTGQPTAFAALQSRITDSGFRRLPVGRIRQLLNSLVICDGERSLETVRSLLKQTALLGRGKLRQVQEIAVNALQLSDSPKAKEFLESLANSRKSSLSTVAKKALLQLRCRLDRSCDAPE
jgi:HEAT repeat protein